MKSSAALICFLVAPVVFADIAQVVYLGGITYLLRDACPERAEFSSHAQYTASLADYQRCIQSQQLWTQCVTDRLQSGKKLTVPVFADYCSAICHQDPNVQDCPVNGRRLDGRNTNNAAGDVNRPIAVPGETSWEIRWQGVVVANISQGVRYSNSETLYEDTVVVPRGNLTFTLFDSFGDGLCCTWGIGSYSVTVNGQEVAQGAAFGSQESTTFVVEPSPHKPRHCFCFDGVHDATKFANDYAVAGGALVHNCSSYNGWKKLFQKAQSLTEFCESKKCQIKLLNRKTCLCCGEPGAFVDLPYCFEATGSSSKDSGSTYTSFLGTHTVWNDNVTEMIKCDPLNPVETMLLGCV